MKTSCLASLVLLLAAGTVFGQQAPSPTAVQEEEVLRPAPFSDQELRVLRSASSLPLERLTELLLVYEKLDNTSMMDALARAILKRDPANVAALRARGLIDPEQETRRVGYLEELAKQVLAGRRVDDTDSVAVQASALATEGKAAEAVRLLEKLRTNQFSGQLFPFLDGLAYAYSESDRFAEAVAAYEEVAAGSSFAPAARSEARQMLPMLRLRLRIARLRRAAGDDPDKLVTSSAALYRELPGEHEVIAFRIECLDRARRYDEAVAMLEAMRKKAPRGKAWPFLPTLAYAYYGAKRTEQAITAFRDIQRNPGFDPATRFEAETMILDIRVAREIELGSAALNRRDFTTARAVLNRLERDFAVHQDVLGYKAIYLAKTGHADEALALLYAKKEAANRERLPFIHQDTLADVYLEQKNYRMAAVATREILDSPLYDGAEKEAAALKLRQIAVSETLDAGYAELGRGRRAGARAILGQLQRMAPQDLEVRMFQAEVALAYHQAAAARDQLVVLKALMPDQPFPAQEALGSAYFRTGEWEEAFAAYDEILHAPGYEPEMAAEALWHLRELRPLIRPNYRLNAAAIDEAEGQSLQTASILSSGWWNEWRLTAFSRSDFIRIEQESALFNETSSERFEAGLTLQRRLGLQHYAEATIGGSENDVIYGAEVGKFSNQALGWSLSFMGNERATDSLSLQALDGRQNRAEFRIGGALGSRWQLDFSAYYQWIHVNNQRLGEGYGVEAAVDYIVLTETRRRPEVAIGYFGEYRRFDSVSSVPSSIADDIRRAVIPQEEVRSALASTEEVRRALAGSFGREVLDRLVDPESNRHGLRVTVRKRLNERLAGYAQVGGYYAFDEESFEYTAAAGMEYHLSETAMIYAELRYDSSGEAASSGQGVLEANVGALISF